MTKYLGYPLLALALALGACSSKKVPVPAPQPSAASSSSASRRKYKPYDRVITDRADTSEGLFKTHLIDDKLFFDIPDSEMGQEMRLDGRIVKAAPAVGASEGA